MTRGPLLLAAALSPAQRVLYDEICAGPRVCADRPVGPVDSLGRLTGPFNAMLYNPAVGHPLQRLGAALRFSSSLADLTRELVILAVAAHHDCAYERVAHQRIAARLGVDEEAFATIEAGLSPLAYPDAAAALGLARAILTGSLPDDDQFKQLRNDPGDAAIFEINTLVGYYSMLAIQLALFDVRPSS